ncbi:MAG: hypothetical protein KKD31_08250 [Bacteroidetes bacterium]|nr:hypothetical protein [Bacteroidota bacterium]
MDIQARKLILIEEFLRISDENLIGKLESLIRQEKKAVKDRELKPMSHDEFYEMIDLAKEDVSAGRVISHQYLKKKIKEWK